MKKYYLMPTAEQSQKSFGYKAIVEVADDGTETLFSYNTKIVSKMPNGELVKHWNGWTMTTGKHIKAFCGMNKKEYFAL
nr:MAG TPA: hypothetical protein [Caudoviricetes sp.]